MPKLLSRSKYEEFESNSALQIGNQKERIAENARKLGDCRKLAGLKNFNNLRIFAGCEITCEIASAATIHLIHCSHFLLFDVLTSFVPFLVFFPFYPL